MHVSYQLEERAVTFKYKSFATIIIFYIYFCFVLLELIFKQEQFAIFITHK